jgi:hypothetical protein
MMAAFKSGADPIYEFGTVCRQPFPNAGKAENGVTSALTVTRPELRNLSPELSI